MQAAYDATADDKVRAIAKTIEADADDLLARAERLSRKVEREVKGHPHQEALAVLLRTTKKMTAEDIVNLTRQAQKSDEW